MVRRLFWAQEKVGSIPAASTAFEGEWARRCALRSNSSATQCPMTRLVSRLACRASEAGSKPAWGATRIRPSQGGKRASKTREGGFESSRSCSRGRAEGCELALQAGFLGALPSDSTITAVHPSSAKVFALLGHGPAPLAQLGRALAWYASDAGSNPAGGSTRV